MYYDQTNTGVSCHFLGVTRATQVLFYPALSFFFEHVPCPPQKSVQEAPVLRLRYPTLSVAFRLQGS